MPLLWVYYLVETVAVPHNWSPLNILIDVTSKVDKGLEYRPIADRGVGTVCCRLHSKCCYIMQYGNSIEMVGIKQGPAASEGRNAGQDKQLHTW